MKLSDAQFGALCTLRDFGPQAATVVNEPNRARLEWNVASMPTITKLEAAGFISITRKPVPRPVNAVGKRGHPRLALVISITPAGRKALDACIS